MLLHPYDFLFVGELFIIKQRTNTLRANQIQRLCSAEDIVDRDHFKVFFSTVHAVQTSRVQHANCPRRVLLLEEYPGLFVMTYDRKREPLERCFG